MEGWARPHPTLLESAEYRTKIFWDIPQGKGLLNKFYYIEIRQKRGSQDNYGVHFGGLLVKALQVGILKNTWLI